MASRVLVLTLLASVAAVEVCPGEGARYGAQAMKPAEPSLHAVLWNAFPLLRVAQVTFDATMMERIGCARSS